MRRFTPALMLALWMACGDSGSASNGSSADDLERRDSGTPACVDADGDGFGRNCEDGPDCDDEDESVFESCLCRSVKQGCGCELDSLPVECELEPEQVHTDSPLCKTGMRYCRDGIWTGCVGLAAVKP